MGKRKSSSVPVSLFSFQDIITSICGIVILLVLMFAIELSRQKASSSGQEKPGGPVDQTPTITNTINKLNSLKGVLDKTRRDKINKGTYEYFKELEEQLTNQLGVLGVEKNETEELTRALTNLIAQCKDLEKKVDETSEEEIVTFIPGKGSKDPVLVECSGTNISVKGKHAKNFDASDRQSALRFLTESLNKSSECLVLMTKPSSVDYAYGFAQELGQGGFTVGWDALEEHKHVQQKQ